MQQRGTNGNMEAEMEERRSPSQSRSRSNTKSKVLVRSHAMREETSPPREPTPTPASALSPCIKLISSPTTSPTHQNPVLVLSPSLSRGNSPCRSPLCVSPTSTLVASPASRNSPQNLCENSHQETTCGRSQMSPENEVTCERSGGSPKYLSKLNKQNLERDCKVLTRTEIIVEETSHYARRKTEKFCSCDCPSTNCIKCLKGQETRNFNNNISGNVNNNVLGNSNTLTVSRTNKGKLRHQSSSQCSFEGSTNNSPCLSRDSSSEQYTDTTGVDLDLFIPETLNKNAKDRALMLRIEQELVNLAKDKVKTHFKFPPMSSYQRMLVHRCAAYFGMDHNIESSGKCVVVNKTKNTRIPDIEFKEHIKSDIVFTEEPRRSILKRDSGSCEDYNFKSPDRQLSMENRRSKSFEEREEEYEKLHDGNSTDEFGWSEVPWSSTDSENSSRFKLLPPDHVCRQHGRLIKVQSEETGETLRPCVAKSYSFGGYGGVSVLTRGDSVMSTHSAGARLFTKQDSAASSVSWRLSPSSSGYKSQSQRSESVTPSPTSTPYPVVESMRQESSFVSDASGEHHDTQLVWAVTDIHNVPKGSIIINPQTGQPYKNQDGSLYHYDPTNPPLERLAEEQLLPSSPQKSNHLLPQKSVKERPPSPKKRTRSSPCKKSNLINSSTSPSLPFTPPLLQNRNSFTFIPNGENVAMPQQFPVYGSNFGSQDASVQLYQPSCIVYAPYSVPVQAQYDGRIEQQIAPEIQSSGYYLNVSAEGNPLGPNTQQIAYQQQQQQQPFWNQQVTYYPNPQHSSQPQPVHRFPVPLPGQTGFVSTSYPPNYLPHTGQSPQTQELVPVYPHQPVQMIYPSQPNQQNSVVYPTQTSMLYAQSAVYPNSVYPASQPVQHYPQSTSTPNSCSSSVSNTAAYCRQMQEVPMHQVTQGIGQMCLSGVPQPHQQNYAFSQNQKMSQQFDGRTRNATPKGNKFSTPKKFVCSSQGSTGTSSPATTVVAGYCNNAPSVGVYRASPETPPIQNVNFGYGGGFVPPPVLYRQMSNASTVGTNRSSRSPTPAGDVVAHLDKQRMSLPPPLYQGMPYILQADGRVMSGRGQPNSYRHNVMSNPGPEGVGFNRSHKGRKARGNKMSGLPPSGKQCNM